jgi:hypothetical protein
MERIHMIWRASFTRPVVAAGSGSNSV